MKGGNKKIDIKVLLTIDKEIYEEYPQFSDDVTAFEFLLEESSSQIEEDVLVSNSKTDFIKAMRGKVSIELKSQSRMITWRVITQSSPDQPSNQEKRENIKDGKSFDYTAFFPSMETFHNMLFGSNSTNNSQYGSEIDYDHLKAQILMLKRKTLGGRITLVFVNLPAAFSAFRKTNKVIKYSLSVLFLRAFHMMLICF